MEYIRLTKENIETEHICCAISNNRDVQVASKKAWLSARFDEGLVFLKSVERGKCFIEYLPAESAWAPIKADGYTYIDCLWVSGALKGHGYSNDLVSACIADSRAKGKRGLCILSAARKLPFLADPKYLLHKGFSVCDRSACGVELWALPFDKAAPPPRFSESAKRPHTDLDGIVIYYTDQCPFNAKYVPILESVAREKGIELHTVHLTTREAAQAAPTPVTTYAVFCDGAYISNEQMNDSRFLKFCEKMKKI